MRLARGQTEPWKIAISPRPWWTALSAASICGPRDSRGDTVYGAVRLLKWLVDRNITPHVPVWDRSARIDGTFSRGRLRLRDQDRNTYICPGGAELTSTGNIDQGHIVYYRASKSDCSQCSLKPKCTTATVRKITRDLNEDVRDGVRALADTEAFLVQCPP